MSSVRHNGRITRISPNNRDKIHTGKVYTHQTHQRQHCVVEVMSGKFRPALDQLAAPWQLTAALVVMTTE